MIETALIIAAGECERWGGRVKQLELVGSETVIGRMIRQLERRGARPVVITHRPELWEACRGGYVPENRETILETMLSTYPLWHGRTAIFFGDVIFSELTLDLAWSRDHFPAFIGNGGENFVIVFDDHGAMREALIEVIRTGGEISWHLYSYLEGIPRDPRGIADPEHRRVYVKTASDDWTDDIDTPEKYRDLIVRLTAKGVLNA